MAASPAPSSHRSPGSSAASLRRSNDDALSIPVDALVNHLLAAKRSLSSMNLVLRANELVNTARQSHEDAAILAAQAGFLRASIVDQAGILVRLSRSLQATYDWGKKDFRKLIRAMDEVDGQLGETMDMLRAAEVQSGLRPDEERKNLLDYVDEDSVQGMRDAMKNSIKELQGIQQSFDGDLLRLDVDVRNLKKIVFDAPQPDDPDDQPPAAELLESMVDHSSNMALLLASLTKHFDMCVTAIRTTEGAAALARRKAAEVTQSQDGMSVSISGVIAEHESNEFDLEPKTAADRAEMLKVVVQDAEEVGDVVQEIQERLAAMEQEHVSLQDEIDRARRAHLGMLDAYAALADVGDRLPDYLAAEDDFRARWEQEKDAVFGKLGEMKDMRDFYEGYASAYGSLVIETERRRAVDERVRGIWRKARESVDKILEADRVSHEAFRQDVGEFLPTDLWACMQGPAKRWEVVPVETDVEVEAEEGEAETSTKTGVDAGEAGDGGSTARRNKSGAHAGAE